MGSRSCLSSDGRFCFCQSDTFAVAKIGMLHSDDLAIERYQLLSDAFWVSDFFTKINFQVLSCCSCQRELDIFLTAISSSNATSNPFLRDLHFMSIMLCA